MFQWLKQMFFKKQGDRAYWILCANCSIETFQITQPLLVTHIIGEKYGYLCEQCKMSLYMNGGTLHKEVKKTPLPSLNFPTSADKLDSTAHSVSVSKKENNDVHNADVARTSILG